jgi:TPP-dependent pyruvate/acetoin dehydrogenase alpha subunit
MKLLGELLETLPLRDCFLTINAAGVLQVPLVISVWDDDYGISVHAKHQTTKENISEI